jgi:hypothetical protein
MPKRVMAVLPWSCTSIESSSGSMALRCASGQGQAGDARQGP